MTVVGTDEVEALLHGLAERFNRVDPDLRRTLLPPRRTIQLSLSDLDVAYHTLLERGELQPLTEGRIQRPDVAVTTTSEDLRAMTTGELAFGVAYASGRIRVEASMLDLLRMRAVL